MTTRTAAFCRTSFVPCRRITLALSALVLSLAVGISQGRAALVTAFSDFGPGNTYGNFGDTIGGQFVNGYQFTASAAGQLARLDVGIGGSGTFDLTLYTDNSGTLGSPIWSGSGFPVGAGSPNPAVVNVVSGPTLGLNQSYWLVASGPSPSAFWSPNTIGATGKHYHHDSGSDSYVDGSRLGAFDALVVPEPATIISLLVGVGVLVIRRVTRDAL